MIDAKELEKKLDYAEKFEFKNPLVLTYQPPAIVIKLTPGMSYDDLSEEFKQQIFNASREGISSMLCQCDEEIRIQKRRGAFRNIHGLESKAMASWCGEVKYSRRPYCDREGNHRYLCDEVLGLDKGQRVSIDMLLRALKLAHEVSYEKVGAQIEAWTGIKRATETYRQWVLRVGEFIVEQEKRKCRAIFENPSYHTDDYGKEPTFLFLEADGCHIFMRIPETLVEQLNAEVQSDKKKGQKMSKKQEARLGLWYEGKAPRRGTEGNEQFEVTGKTYFGGLMEVDAFWEIAAVAGLERYGLGPLTHVFGNGDGGKWIGPHFEDFQNNTFSLCRFHWKREIFRAFAHDKESGVEKGQKLIACVESNAKGEVCSFIDSELNACVKERAKKQITKLKKYLLNQWDYIQNYGRLKEIVEKIDPALARVGVIEGHIYQVLYLRFESRGGYWGEEGLNALFRVLISDLNGVLDQLIHKYGWRANVNAEVSLEKEKRPEKKKRTESKCRCGVFPALQRPLRPLSETLKSIAHPV
jgi:hypothetical protein